MQVKVNQRHKNPDEITIYISDDGDSLIYNTREIALTTPQAYSLKFVNSVRAEYNLPPITEKERLAGKV